MCIFDDFRCKKILDIDLQSWMLFFTGHPVDFIVEPWNG